MPSSSSPSSTQQQLMTIDESVTLIPGLPYDVASLILSFIPYSHQSRLKATCKSWCLFFSSKTLIFHRRKLSRLSHLLCIFPEDPSISSPFLFDASNLAWRPLPPLPCNPSTYSLTNFTSVSLGPDVYLVGGSHFDARSFPLDLPLPTDSAFRFNFITFSWERIAPMISPRGSFACAAVPGLNQIIVAGGGSRHSLFAAGGSRISSVERYDVARNEWVEMDGLPRFRAGCVGFMAEESGEFWVMGGYGDSRTVSGVFPVDEYYRDAVVLELKKNDDDGSHGWGTWREVGDMWGEGERTRLGKIVVMEDEDHRRPEVFMLDNNDISRYDKALNRWHKETSVPRKVPCKKSFGFVALNGELHVMSPVNGIDSMETRRPRQHKRGTLFIQVYHPRKKTWRSIYTKPPFPQPLDFSTAVMCSIKL
ncbi:F-box/kelch-repeat protein OR23-like [Pistacia vera]|uniref:F-box/kelch-repeat protein OR23-like n=2 Tax=Pistacia vera TaxID=55513 RepID=UPI001262C3DE|nr:F-box/kelch-repeat protein OR23-like [Pistacia vera]XP_031262447.1 F-box/kelch-repeat protein OR23-like [Pistacia vera]